ncbi:hypothetical protein AYO45_03050 [Gammaproteobacteria bacterium SCGC AG-212-F23]|nr:hypothetical protein AYO45_03050 [Gammaproteobacteria bacterium SCGC AG-212-F23]
MRRYSLIMNSKATTSTAATISTIAMTNSIVTTTTVAAVKQTIKQKMVVFIWPESEKNESCCVGVAQYSETDNHLNIIAETQDHLDYGDILLKQISQYCSVYEVKGIDINFINIPSAKLPQLLAGLLTILQQNKVRLVSCCLGLDETVVFENCFALFREFVDYLKSSVHQVSLDITSMKNQKIKDVLDDLLKPSAGLQLFGLQIFKGGDINLFTDIISSSKKLDTLFLQRYANSDNKGVPDSNSRIHAALAKILQNKRINKLKLAMDYSNEIISLLAETLQHNECQIRSLSLTGEMVAEPIELYAAVKDSKSIESLNLDLDLIRYNGDSDTIHRGFLKSISSNEILHELQIHSLNNLEDLFIETPDLFNNFLRSFSWSHESNLNYQPNRAEQNVTMDKFGEALLAETCHLTALNLDLSKSDPGVMGSALSTLIYALQRNTKLQSFHSNVACRLEGVPGPEHNSPPLGRIWKDFFRYTHLTVVSLPNVELDYHLKLLDDFIEGLRQHENKTLQVVEFSTSFLVDGSLNIDNVPKCDALPTEKMQSLLRANKSLHFFGSRELQQRLGIDEKMTARRQAIIYWMGTSVFTAFYSSNNNHAFRTCIIPLLPQIIISVCDTQSKLDPELIPKAEMYSRLISSQFFMNGMSLPAVSAATTVTRATMSDVKSTKRKFGH